MANWCSFKMMVRGEPKNVDTFYGYLTDYENSPRYFARIFNAEKDSESCAEGIKTLRLSGDCAWSVYSCMCEGEYTYYSESHESDPKLTCLREVTELLHLEVEIKSEEPGMGFWEHFQYKDGDCLCDETGDLLSDGFDMDDVA